MKPPKINTSMRQAFDSQNHDFYQESWKTILK